MKSWTRAEDEERRKSCWLWRNPNIRYLYNCVIKLSHSSPCTSQSRKPCVLLHAKPHHCLLPTGIVTSLHQHLALQPSGLWEAGEMRSAQQGGIPQLPLITSAKLLLWRRQTCRAWSFPKGLILHTGRAGPAGVTARIAWLSCAAQVGFDFLWQ